MRFSKVIRQVHRVCSMLLVALVLLIFAWQAMGQVVMWVYYLPLAPLAVLMITGTWMFVQPYLQRGRTQG